MSDSCCSPLHQPAVRPPSYKDDLRPTGRRSTDDSKVTYTSLATPGQPLAAREVLDNVRLQKLFRNLRHQVCSPEQQQQVHLLSPLVPSTYLLCGLAKIDFGEHLRFTMPWALAACGIMLVACLLFGIFPLRA